VCVYVCERERVCGWGRWFWVRVPSWGGDIGGSNLGISEEKVKNLGISDMKMKNLGTSEKTQICSIFYQFEIPFGKSRILNDNLVISDKENIKSRYLGGQKGKISVSKG